MRWRRGWAFLAVAAVAVGPSGGLPAGATPPTGFPARRAAALLAERVRRDGLDGGVLAVGRDGTWSVSATGITAGSVMPIASASKWLTAATLMTLVDEGRLDLDTPIADLLPGFDGSGVRVRHLLAHTSGLVADACVYSGAGTTAACTARLAAGPAPTSRPGTRFAYSGVGYEVAGRIVEVLSGVPFETAFAQRIAIPLGMERTSFVGAAGQTHPVPSASATSSASDYLRFLAMLAADGVARTGPAAGTRILAAGSVAAIEADQVRGIDTRADGAVRTTGIPTYGLGVWRDVVSVDDRVRVVSGNGAFGFYPWIDRRPAGASTFGVVAVADLVHGADYAVPRSQRIARAAWREVAGFAWPPADGG